MKKSATGWAVAVGIVWAAACQPQPERPLALSLGELELSGTTGTGEPHLFAAPDGRVHLTWLEPVEEGYALRLSTRSDGAWSPPRTVRESDRFFVNWADFPSSMEMADGTLVAHWLEKVADAPYAYHVMISLSHDDGASWTPPFRAHDDTTPTEHGFVAMVPWEDGAALVWLDGRAMQDPGQDGATGHEPPGGHGPSGAMSVRFRTLAPDGSLGPEVLLDDRTCECCQTAIARGSEGLIAAYRDRSEAEVRDIAIVRGAGETWSEPSHVSEDGWVIPGCPVNGPQLSTDGSDVAAAWYTAGDGDPHVYVAFSADGGATFGGRIRVDEGLPMGRVDIERLDDGSAVVVWLEASGGTARVLARRVTDAGALDGSLLVSETSGARASGFPRMARTGDELFLAWTLPGDEGGVRVRRLQVSD